MFRRLGFVVAASECEAVALCEPGAIERVLKLLRTRITDQAERQRQTARAGASAEADSLQAREITPLLQPVWVWLQALSAKKQGCMEVQLKNQHISTLSGHSSHACMPSQSQSL